METLYDQMRRPASRAPRRRVAVAVISAMLATLASPWSAAQTAFLGCGNPFVNGFGPHDYRVEQGQKLKVVEDYHFTQRVESLISGRSASLGADIDYTLRAFPNHHRALISMMNLGARQKNPVPPGAQFSVECYFTRALQFRPDDAIARMIYAKYLASNGRKPDAIRELEYTVRTAQENAFTQYNAGMIYFEMGEFDKALLQAHRALGLGFERPGLKQQLQGAGKWVEPAAAASAPDSGVTSAAPASDAGSQPSR